MRRIGNSSPVTRRRRLRPTDDMDSVVKSKSNASAAESTPSQNAPPPASNVGGVAGMRDASPPQQMLDDSPQHQRVATCPRYAVERMLVCRFGGAQRSNLLE